MKDNLERRIIAVFLLVLAILIGVAIIAVRNIRSSAASSDWVNHTHAVIMETDAILSSLRDGDAALRAYLLTGDARDQALYWEAYTAMDEHLEVTKALTRNEPQGRKVAELEPLIAQCVDLAREMINVRQQEGIEGIRKLLATDAAGQVQREIQRLVGKMKEEQKRLLQERDKASYLQAQATRWLVWTGVIFNFLLLALVGWLVRDDLAARRKAASVLQEANAQLEAKVAERSAELVRANQALKEENLERQWANQALERQLRHHNLIINSMDNPILVITTAENITRINAAVAQRTGFSAQELIGGPLHRLVQLAGDQSAGMKSHTVKQAIKDGHEIHDCPANLLRKDGQIAPARFNLYPLRDQNKVVGGVVTLRLVAGQNRGLV